MFVKWHPSFSVICFVHDLELCKTISSTGITEPMQYFMSRYASFLEMSWFWSWQLLSWSWGGDWCIGLVLGVEGCCLGLVLVSNGTVLITSPVVIPCESKDQTLSIIHWKNICWFSTFSSANFQRNSVCSHSTDFHLTSNMLLHYCVNLNIHLNLINFHCKQSEAQTCSSLKVHLILVRQTAVQMCLKLGSRQTSNNTTMKKTLRETQTLHTGCSKAELKVFAPPQTRFPGAQDGQNLISWR